MNKDEIFTRFKNELPLNFFGLHEEEKDQIFEWFWKHLEQRETESYENGYQDAKDGLFVSDLQAKIQSLEQILKAADEVIDKSNKLFSSLYEATEKSGAKVLITDADNINIQSIKLAELIESYTTLKQQMK